jgi:DHA2 family multidrug resistance protein
MMCGTAASLDEMVVCRFLQGLAGAALQPLSQAVLMETFAPEEQTMAMGVWGLGVVVAPIMGPTVGGYITENWNWRWNFYINVPIGIVAAFMVSTFVTDPPYLRNLKGKEPADYLGLTCLVISLSLGELVMDRGERADWFASSWVVYCSLIALITFGLLIIHELRVADPVIRLRILRSFNFSLPTAMVILMSFVSYGMQILNPIFLQELLGYTAWKAGLAMAPRGLGVMPAMFFTGWLGKRGVRLRPFVGLGFLLVALANWRLAHLDITMSIYDFVWPTLIQGIGFGLIFPFLSSTALGSIKREDMSHATSLFSMTRNIGASLGTSVLTTMLVRSMQMRQSYLVQHVSVFDAWRMSNAPLQVPGALPFNFMHQIVSGQRQGLTILYRQVQAQSMILSLNTLFELLCAVMIVASTSCLLLPSRK